jgi:hypothetical protein
MNIEEHIDNKDIIQKSNNCNYCKIPTEYFCDYCYTDYCISCLSGEVLVKKTLPSRRRYINGIYKLYCVPCKNYNDILKTDIVNEMIFLTEIRKIN